MNISVKINSDDFNLGMIRMEGSYLAERCLHFIIERLDDFGLDLKRDVVGFCTDGASVMVKLGKISPTLHQQCYAHALHLAITGALYRNLQMKLQRKPQLKLIMLKIPMMKNWMILL
jgi:hypothetical protein